MPGTNIREHVDDGSINIREHVDDGSINIREHVDDGSINIRGLQVSILSKGSNIV
jgi:hypothetical protein